MIFKYISNNLKWFKNILIVFLFNTLLIEPIFAQSADENVLIQNVKWVIKSEVIIINYDLVGSLKDQYEIKVVMKKQDDPDFQFIPRAVEGDIGIGYFAGLKKEITWYYRRDIPQGITADEKYYFIVNVKEIKSSKSWIYYLVGGVLATGAAIILLSSKSKEQGQKELPLPPGRP
ncbi:MAG: hypothetical protein IGBAC_0325 [Ignavibacteriae bacterium]|nr:MAG: hypothetical protein IGBAC_0325 [Ignavibacteriota bacterium]